MPSQNRLRFALTYVLISAAWFAFATTALADKPDRSERVRSTEDAKPADPGFTWRRDRPYGELGFPGDGFGPHWEFLRLATHTPVQEELDLSPEQIEQLQAVYQSLMSAQPKWGAGRDEPDVLKAPYEKARAILTEEQSLRIEQIKLQRRGVLAFLDPDVQETLDMDQKQIEKIRGAWKEHAAKAAEGWKGDEGRRSHHNVWKLALQTLSESQRHKFYEMTGPLVDQRE